MKRIFILLLSLVMVFSAMPIIPVLAAENVAYPSTQQVNVDGTAVEFQMYALRDENGNATNYVKVRDVAYILNGTAAQFAVNWDGTVNLIPGQAYESNGSEMFTPFSGERAYTPATAPTQVNAQDAALDAIVLTDDNGGGYTYYKLRDLGAALGFTVDWSAETGVYIETEAGPATDEAPYPVTLYALNGRTCEVPSNQVEDYLAVGWYYTPVTTLYATDGRTLVVPTSEVDAYTSAGWYADINDAKVTLYAINGRTIAVWSNEVDDYLSVGWYRSASEASAHAIPFDPDSLKLVSVDIFRDVDAFRTPVMYLNFEASGFESVNLSSYVTYEDHMLVLNKESSHVSESNGKAYKTFMYKPPYSSILKPGDIPEKRGAGYIYFTANGVRYMLKFTKQGSSIHDFTYSITKLD